MNNSVLLPPRLRPGGRIGVVSPSTPVLPDLEGQWERGQAFLESLGFEVVPGRHVRSTSWGYTASPEEKAEDINGMFADASIQAIICSQGGATANACLDQLDWSLVRSHPKIFLGISDITVLLNAIYQKTGLVTFHGDDIVWGLGHNAVDYDRQEFLSRLVEARVGEIPSNGPRRTIRPGRAEGRLLGGNITALLKLAGTSYFPDLTDAILFLESFNITPEICDYYFQHLIQMGVFDRVRGVLIGFNAGLEDDEKAATQMEDILLQVTRKYSFPILKVKDFGHMTPNTTLPVGGRVRMEADARTVEILEPCVA